MSATFIHDGCYLDFTPPADVLAGTVVVLADAVGITRRPIPAGTLGALAMEGVFDVPRAPGGVINQGTRLYWDAATQRVTLNAVDPITALANPALGICALTSPDTAVSIRVRLNH
ncbi:MAG: DUF2190 family protein [Planctomycetes bacterium]|nr:DUF2190 family protein [Planctomycetota bacterium]